MTVEEMIGIVSEAIQLEFLSNWQREPFCWLYEADVQTELTKLIRNHLRTDERGDIFMLGTPLHLIRISYICLRELAVNLV